MTAYESLKALNGNPQIDSETHQNALGPEHPVVAQSLKNYAGLLRQMGRDAEAAKMEERAKAIMGSSK